MLAHRRAGRWPRLRALVLAAVVFIGGFGLPAFDAIAYHWHPLPNSPLAGRSRVQQYGTPQDHAVQCVISHNAPAPRLLTVRADHLPIVAIVRQAFTARTPTEPDSADPYSPNQSRAPPASLA